MSLCANGGYSFTTSICFVDYLPGKPVDRYVHPVVLFPFRDEIILEALCIWLAVTGLGYHIDQYVPNARLRDERYRPEEQLPVEP